MKCFKGKNQSNKRKLDVLVLYPRLEKIGLCWIIDGNQNCCPEHHILTNTNLHQHCAVLCVLKGNKKVKLPLNFYAMASFKLTLLQVLYPIIF